MIADKKTVTADGRVEQALVVSEEEITGRAGAVVRKLWPDDRGEWGLELSLGDGDIEVVGEISLDGVSKGKHVLFASDELYERLHKEFGEEDVSVIWTTSLDHDQGVIVPEGLWATRIIIIHEPAATQVAASNAQVDQA